MPQWDLKIIESFSRYLVLVSLVPRLLPICIAKLHGEEPGYEASPGINQTFVSPLKYQSLLAMVFLQKQLRQQLACWHEEAQQGTKIFITDFRSAWFWRVEGVECPEADCLKSCLGWASFDALYFKSVKILFSLSDQFWNYERSCKAPKI